MSMLVSAKREDLLKSRMVVPGVYPVTITKVVQTDAKTDRSTNTTFTFAINGGPFDGTPIDLLFNEKQIARAQELFSVLLKKRWEGEQIDLENSVGKKLKIHVFNDPGNKFGKVNQIDGYMPMES
jgi:hypothetical protein